MPSTLEVNPNPAAYDSEASLAISKSYLRFSSVVSHNSPAPSESEFDRSSLQPPVALSITDTNLASDVPTRKYRKQILTQVKPAFVNEPPYNNFNLFS